MDKFLLSICIVLVSATSSDAGLHTEAVQYRDGETVLEGYLAYDDSIKGKRPGVMVVHEWWGLNDYIKGRAEQLGNS